MKTTGKEFEEMVTKITKEVVSHVMKMNKEQIVIEAITNEIFPVTEAPTEISDIEKYIIIGRDFSDLSTREKLLVIKSAIHTHYRVVDKIVIGLGEIVAYELQFTKKNKDYKVLFGTDGTLLEENMEQYL